jgi:hypothetical protein
LEPLKKVEYSRAPLGLNLLTNAAIPEPPGQFGVSTPFGYELGLHTV